MIESVQKTNNSVKYEPIRDIFKRLGLLYPEYKKKYVLNNGLTIINRKQIVKGIYQCKEIIGFDSETYQGTCKLLCNSKNEYVLNPTFLDCLDFLFKYAKNVGTYRLFYNIDFDFSAIIKTWNSTNMFHTLRLMWLRKGIEVRYKKYLIKWIKGRLLSIRHITRKRSVVFTDIFNFFNIGLNKASKQYIKDVKIDDIDGNLLNNSLEYWNENLQKIIVYCLKDCELTEKLGKILIDGIQECKLPLPKYLVSSASLSKQLFRKTCNIPRISHIPEKILQIAYNTYFGGCFLMLKKGYFENLYLRDINSQYPTFIRKMPDLARGSWHKTTKIPRKETFGFYLVQVDIPYDYKIPTIPIHHKGVNKFPCGKFKKWITWYDIDLIRDFIVKVYDGYEFLEAGKFYDSRLRPFWKAIDLLYSEKDKNKGINDLFYRLFKLTMNADYGCYIEVQKKYDHRFNETLHSGVMFNPVYATMITAFGRWSVIKDIPREKHENIVAIHTDSLISDCCLDEYLDIGSKLGQWSIENTHYEKCNIEKSAKGIILNTGMYQIGKIVKTRGVPSKFIKNWLRFCTKNGIYKKKTFEVKRMRKLAECLMRDKNLENLNTFKSEPRTINPNSDSKRSWIDNFSSFNDVLSRNIDSYAPVCHFDYSRLYNNPISTAIRYERSLN